jgi:FKBP-type peptidyl-prolyl cis-trans isomerase (trigger factor)
LTVQTINRYVYCLNKVIESGHISLVDLRNDIKNDLEKAKGFEIDKKTLKRIIEKLVKDKLLKTVDFLVTV